MNFVPLIFDKNFELRNSGCVGEQFSQRQSNYGQLDQTERLPCGYYVDV